MARRKTSKPNLPADTLARARAQADEENDAAPSADLPEATTAEPVMDELIVVEEAAPVMAQRPARPRPARTSTSKRLQQAQAERQKKKAALEPETIKEMLLNPTRFPSAQELARDYAFVVKDLRNMFVLSIVLVIFLVALAGLLP
jgi:hypothetical protein